MPRTSSRIRKTSLKTSIKLEQTAWDLKPLFASDNDPRMEEKRKIVEQKSYEFINAWKDRADYLIDSEVLRRALDHYEEWKRSYGADGDEGYYFWLRTQQDQNDPKLKAKYNKIEEFSKKVEKAIEQYVRPMLQNDGGNVEIIDIKDTLVYCRLTGACQGCASANQTLRMLVEQTLKEMVDQRIRVIGV